MSPSGLMVLTTATPKHMSPPAPASRPLQPEEELLVELAEVEEQAAAQRLERLADQEIVTTLQLQGS